MLGASSVLYVGTWGTLPLLDKTALTALEPMQLLWGTFTIAYSIFTVLFLSLNRRQEVMRIFREKNGIVWLTGSLTALGYIAYVYMMARIHVHQMALIAPMVPVLTLILSVTLLKERMSWMQAAGASIIVLGLFVFYAKDIHAYLLTAAPGA